MSGFEVVSLVLGVLSICGLVFSALKYCCIKVERFEHSKQGRSRLVKEVKEIEENIEQSLCNLCELLNLDVKEWTIINVDNLVRILKESILRLDQKSRQYKFCNAALIQADTFSNTKASLMEDLSSEQVST